MKYLLSLYTLLVLAACNTTPTIIPDTTKDNVVMQKLKWEIGNNHVVSSNWGWIMWYLPVVVIAMMWAWRQFVKPCPQCEEEQSKNIKP